MATFNKFNSFVEALAEKVHDLGADTLEIALTDVAPVAGNTILANITQISYANLPADRTLTRVSSSQTGGTYTLVLADKTLTATGNVAQFRYVVIFNQSALNDELIGWYDYGSEINLVNTDAFVIDFGASLISLT